MRAHYLQHVPYEGPGSIGPWLRDTGYTLTSTPLYKTADLPRPEDLDLLVIMGGPMSVNDSHRLPWLEREKAFIRQVIEAGKPVLGVCLGAQLIAAAMGARVYPNPVKEIGWFPVRGSAFHGEGIFSFPEAIEVLHWHGDTFELPAGAIHLAGNDACKNQAFQLGNSVIGLQFHLETTPESLAELVAHSRDELVPDRYVQAEADIVADADGRYRRINELMERVLLFLHAAVTDRGDS